MTDNAKKPSPEADQDSLKGEKKSVERDAQRDEASLREQPEDRRETARQTTPAGKARSK